MKPSALVVLTLALLTSPSAAFAHSLEFGVLVITEDPRGATLVLRAGGREGRPPLLDLRVSGACALDGPSTRELARGLLIVRARATCFEGARVEITGLERAGLRVTVHLRRADGSGTLRFLDPSNTSSLIAASSGPSAPGTAHVFERYARLGVEHLAFGFDHLLFLLALLLVVLDPRVPRRAPVRALLITVTGFTAGHALTLTLAVLGGLSLPSAPVELCIALSIVFLAAEIIRTKTSLAFERPWLVAATFGLLHGLGFAGALRELGLPVEDAPAALFAFHVGLEFAQLLFVLLALAALRLLRRLERSPREFAYAIGGTASLFVGLRIGEL